MQVTLLVKAVLHLASLEVRDSLQRGPARQKATFAVIVMAGMLRFNGVLVESTASAELGIPHSRAVLIEI